MIFRTRWSMRTSNKTKKSFMKRLSMLSSLFTLSFFRSRMPSSIELIGSWKSWGETWIYKRPLLLRLTKKWMRIQNSRVLKKATQLKSHSLLKHGQGIDQFRVRMTRKIKSRDQRLERLRISKLASDKILSTNWLPTCDWKYTTIPRARNKKIEKRVSKMISLGFTRKKCRSKRKRKKKEKKSLWKQTGLDMTK